MINDILAEQTYDVDTVSGATFSSSGIMDAVADALESGQNESSQPVDSDKDDAAGGENGSESGRLEAISPLKDVDGFHPQNVGKMYIGEKTLLPCTPKGIIRILEELGFGDLTGKKAVVFGRSNIVGKPIAKLLLNKNATVTICHSKTKNIIEEARQADIIVSATGQAKLVKKEWIKEGAVVIDVGMNRDEQGKYD